MSAGVFQRRRRGGRLVVTALAGAALAGAGLLGTFAAFSDTAENDGNSYAVGTLDITDDATGSTIVPIGGLLPGDSVERCVNLRNAGSIGFANVALSGVVGGGPALADALTVAVDRGTGALGGEQADCAGFAPATAGIVNGPLSAFPTLAAPVDDGAAWQPGAIKSYRFTVALPQSAPNTAQGQTATLTVSWDATS